MTLVCASCGQANAEGMKFCGECGAKLVAQPGAPQQTRKVVTILFADVTGSTSLGERLDPEALRALMTRYFSVMRTIVERHGGTVEKFIGDAVMAVFGIPVVHEDDALRAVRAASEIRDALSAMNAELEATRGFAIRFRTGITTGPVVAGVPGSTTLVTGDAVNTAARLEQAAPPGGILLGEPTYRLVRDAVEVERVDPIVAKGKAEALLGHRLITVRTRVDGRTRRLDTRLVGREPELERLRQAFAGAARDRRCHLFTLLGSAGAGKSRLVAEFLAGSGDEALVLHGRCLSYGEGITYWPIAEIVRAVARIEDADALETARSRLFDLVRDAPDGDAIAQRLAAAIGLSDEPAPQPELFWAVRRTFEQLAVEKPLIVVVEDIHWAEPTLLDLLEHLADRSREAAILLLCPARPELLDRRPGWSGGKLNATTVLLEPLDGDATGRLIDILPGGAALPSAVREAVVRAAEGNPLYVEEFVGMLIDDGHLRQDEVGEWWAPSTSIDVPIPLSITALLAARLERLDHLEQLVAQHASVVGRRFEQGAVTELIPVDVRSQLDATLEALIRKELVRPDASDLVPGDAFSFRHILIRDAAYDALPIADRAALHERFVGWLTDVLGDRLPEVEEILASHLVQAFDYRRALGESGPAMEALAERAAMHLSAAIERAGIREDLRAIVALSLILIRLPVDGRLLVRPLLLAQRAMKGTGRFGDAARAIERLTDVATSSGDPLIAARAELARVHLKLDTDPAVDRSRAIERLAVIAADLEQLGDDTGVAEALRLVGALAAIAGDEARAMTAARAALDAARRTGDKVLVGRCQTIVSLNLINSSTSLSMTAAEIQAMVDEGVARLQTAIMRLDLASVLAAMGHFDTARAAVDSAEKDIVEIGHTDGATDWIRGDIDMLDDRPAAAAEHYRRVRDLQDGSGETWTRAQLDAPFAEALCRAGRPAEALELAVLPEAPAPGDSIAIDLYGVRALATAYSGDGPSAIALARTAVALADPVLATEAGLRARLRSAEVLLMHGDADEGRRIAADVRAGYEELGHVVGATRAAALAAAPGET